MILCVSVLLSALMGCYTVLTRRGQQVQRPYILKISDSNLLHRFTVDYYISYDSIIVIARQNKLKSVSRQIYSGRLTAEESQRWNIYIDSFPVETLDARYENLNVYDGHVRSFDFNLGSVEREVLLRNVDVELLSELCDEVNRLLPEDSAIGRIPLSVLYETGSYDQPSLPEDK
jgi:hypothetical protein